jgi:Predicted RNA-binding protein containing KH domain, possibly ribosomal protein
MLQSEIEWQKERKSRMTSKERAELKAQAMKLDSIFQIGKASLTPQLVEAVKDALAARELIKVSVLKNCADDPRELAEIVSERTGSQVVQVIGKKIVLYKKNMEKEEKRRRALKLKAGAGERTRRNG